MSTPAPYVALVPAGPGPLEAERIRDLHDAIQTIEGAGCATLVVLNDGNAAIAEWSPQPSLAVWENPRAGRGWGWGGGLTAGQLWAWQQILHHFPHVGAVVKFDTDALLIRALAAPLAAAFSTPVVGMVGSHITVAPLPPGKTTNPHAYFAGKVRKLRAPLSLWRKPRWHVRQALWGENRWIAELYRQAERNGYFPGELIEGGAFAVSAPTIRALNDHGLLNRWPEFLNLPVSDDIILTMLPYLVGHRAAASRAFAIEPATLPAAPDELTRRPEVCAVHSLKRYADLNEPTLRARFRELRRGDR